MTPRIPLTKAAKRKPVYWIKYRDGWMEFYGWWELDLWRATHPKFRRAEVHRFADELPEGYEGAEEVEP